MRIAQSFGTCRRRRVVQGIVHRTTRVRDSTCHIDKRHTVGVIEKLLRKVDIFHTMYGSNLEISTRIRTCHGRVLVLQHALVSFRP